MHLADIDWTALTLRTYIPSPAWKDQLLYFLMLDRFSDGQETGFRDTAEACERRPPFRFRGRCPPPLSVGHGRWQEMDGWAER